jgi:hypothetical protein
VSSLTAAVNSGQSRVFILGSVNRDTPIQVNVAVPASEGGQTLSACVSLGQEATKGQRALNLVGLGDYFNEDGPSIYNININGTSDHSLSCVMIY